MQYYNNKTDDVLKELKTTKDGLTEKEATKRLDIYGENLIREGRKETTFHKFIKQFNDTMIIILLIVDIVMLIYGLLLSHDYTDSIVITVVVMLLVVFLAILLAALIQQMATFVENIIEEISLR